MTDHPTQGEAAALPADDATATATAAPFTVRASSWGRLFDCAHAWEGVHVMGLRSVSGLRAQLGTAIHASTARYDSGRLPGGDAVSVDDAAGELVDALRRPDRDVDYGRDALTVNEAERIGLQLHAMYCLDLSPAYTFLSVEQRLDPLEIDCGGGVLVRLTGSMDRARVATVGDGGGIIIPDIKTGARVIENGEVQTAKHWPQLEVYRLMYEATERQPTLGGQVLGLKTSGKPQAMASGVIDRRAAMVGTPGQPGLIEHAAAMFRSGLFPPNPQSMLCSEAYCPRWATCAFKG